MKIGLTFNAKAETADELRRRGVTITDDSLEEFDSDETIDGLVAALGRVFAGAEVHRLGWGAPLLDRLKQVSPDIVFNIAEGLGGRSREAQVPALLEMLDVPFVGSDALALAVSLDKAATKALVSAAGVAVPSGFVVRERTDLGKHRGQVVFPVVVKPLHEGSSRGVRDHSFCADEAALEARVASILELYGEPAIVETYVEGRELTVGIVGDPPRVVGVMEIERRDPAREWKLYSVDVKRNYRELALFTCPARIGSAESHAVARAALAAFDALGCKDLARVDFRLRPDGTPVFIEINPLPGLDWITGDLCVLSRLQGIPYENLLSQIVDGALRRHGLPKPRRLPLYPDLPCHPCPHESACCFYGASLVGSEAEALRKQFGAEAVRWDDQEKEFRTAVVDGKCFFLRDNACKLHGSPDYPATCAGFPWTDGETDGPYEHDRSICPEIAETMGPWREQ